MVPFPCLAFFSNLLSGARTREMRRYMKEVVRETSGEEKRPIIVTFYYDRDIEMCKKKTLQGKSAYEVRTPKTSGRGVMEHSDVIKSERKLNRPCSEDTCERGDVLVVAASSAKGLGRLEGRTRTVSERDMRDSKGENA